MRFKQYLNEGIVKVDKDVLNVMTYFTLITTFEKAIEYFQGMKKEKEGLLKSYKKKYEREYNKLTKKVDVWNASKEVGRISVSLNDRRYVDKELVIYYRILFDFPNRRVNGAFAPPNEILINMNSMQYVYELQEIIDFSKPDKKMNILESSIRATLEHEIIHLIRSNISIRKGIQEPSMKPNYETDTSEYMTSDAEIESWALNTINAFKQTINDISFDFKVPKEDLKGLLKYWLLDRSKPAKDAYKKYSSFIDKNYEFDGAFSFLTYLKKLEPKKYKSVTNKVYQELVKYINKLQ